MQIKTILFVLTPILGLVAANPVAVAAEVQNEPRAAAGKYCPGWCGGGTVSGSRLLLPM